MKKEKPITIAITGASGSVYGIRLVEALLSSGREVYITISDAGFIVLKEETGIDWKGSEAEINNQARKHFKCGDNLRFFSNSNFFSPLASGSSCSDVMIVAPCSMGTLGRIAGGMSGNLTERAADVILKEGKRLVLIPRETPLNEIHLENMLKLSRIGVKIVPAMPAFYQRPQKIEDLVDFIAGRVLDIIGVENNLVKPWAS